MKFRLLWGFDALASLVVVWFFVVGVFDGSVSAFNVVLWLGLLGAAATVLGGSLWLHGRGQTLAAALVLLLIALPAALFSLFLLAILVAQPRWN